MALRCPRCRAHEIALETFGVYRCPQCGRIDADGRPLARDGVPGAPAFAAPPPPAEPGPVAADLVRGASSHGSGGMPPLFAAMLAIDAILIVLVGIAVGRFIRMFFSLAFLVPLASGRIWARNLALVGATLEIFTAALLFVFLAPLLTTPLRALIGLDVMLQLVWIYVLFRDDTVTYFVRQR